MIEWFYLQIQTSSRSTLRILLIEIDAYLESFGVVGP